LLQKLNTYTAKKKYCQFKTGSEHENSLYIKVQSWKYEYFIQSLWKKIFHINLFSYITENAHIFYISQYLDSILETEWNYEKDKSINHTWEFKNFLLKISKDSANHKKNASQHLINPHQCDIQSVQNFVSWAKILRFLGVIPSLPFSSSHIFSCFHFF